MCLVSRSQIGTLFDTLLSVRVHLQKMVHGAKALAYLPEGRVVLVRGGLPGEQVEVDAREHSGVLQGEVTRVLEPSPERIPASEHPGLDYSHIRYPHQLFLKREVVLDALTRSLRRDVDTAIPAVIAAPRLWHYRNTVQPVVTPHGLGYRQPERREPVTLREDPSAYESINQAWQVWLECGPVKGVRELVFRANAEGEVLLALVATAPQRSLLELAHDLVRAGLTGVSYAPFDARGRFRGGVERLAGARAIRERYGRFDIEVSASSFAQPNPAAAVQLYHALAEMAPPGREALELYAGSGIISMHLADKFERILALEIDRGGVTRGQRDLARLGIDNVELVKCDAKRVDIPQTAELICVDPPRAGLAKGVREAIIASKAKTLLYVSCDVATWARDVAHFVSAGFRLEQVQPFDFYPHTHHIELLSKLTRPASA